MRFLRADEPPYYLHTGEENPEVFRTSFDLQVELDELPEHRRALAERSGHGGPAARRAPRQGAPAPDRLSEHPSSGGRGASFGSTPPTPGEDQ